MINISEQESWWRGIDATNNSALADSPSTTTTNTVYTQNNGNENSITWDNTVTTENIADFMFPNTNGTSIPNILPETTVDNTINISGFRFPNDIEELTKRIEYLEKILDKDIKIDKLKEANIKI